MRRRILQGLILGACLGLLATNSVRADGPTQKPGNRRPAALLTDVALRDGGELVGARVGSDGGGIAGAVVTVHQILHDNSRPAPITTITDTHGRFSVSGLRGGVYFIHSGDDSASCRLWAPGTAPPKARDWVLLTGEEPVVRGQLGGQLFTPARAIFTAAAAGGAIAIGAQRSVQERDVLPISP